ncbi:hypothetical protein ABEB36_002876 [Hypothenemus hampei]|uniref:Ig-like domain-containing protein n=1 Tax=Hypothenemus hampei TaxID=57062 RepID=A0ABD1F9Y6_HYPHA
MRTLVYLLIITYVTAQNDEQLEKKVCRERERLIASDKEDFYALVDVIERQNLVLRCRFCKEEPSTRPKNWFKVDHIGVSEPHEVKLDIDNDINRNRISVNHKHSLLIRNFSIEDVGFYYCIHYEDKTNNEKFNFLVDIVFPEKQIPVEKGSITDWSRYHDDYFSPVNLLFNSSTAPEFVYFRNVLKVNAELVTQWDPWTACQACNRPAGEAVMKRTGSCKIKLTSFGNHGRNLTPDKVYLLNAPAISCKSEKLFHIFPMISNYTRAIPDFVLQDKCIATCNPDSEGINKGWKVGKKKGFKYRKHSVLEEGSHLIFICPESTLNNKVVWKKNGHTLKIGDNSNPHVIVDTFNTLYLIEVTKFVAGNYTCYVDNIQMEQIIVFVYTKSKFLTNELLRYLIYLGFILFLSSFCYCAGLIITWRRRHLFKTYKELQDEQAKKDYDELENLI